MDRPSESTVIQIKQPKNYGSLTVPSEPFQSLTYTWTNIDVFGEAPNHVSTYSTLSNRVKSCFAKDHQRVPTPRKHLLKNVSGVAYAGEMLAVLGSRCDSTITIHHLCNVCLQIIECINFPTVVPAKQRCWMPCHFDRRRAYKYPIRRSVRSTESL